MANYEQKVNGEQNQAHGLTHSGNLPVMRLRCRETMPRLQSLCRGMEADR
jgi:hypothetical protein